MRADGTVAWQALFRVGKKQRSATFPDAAARDRWIKLVDNIGIEAAVEVLEATEDGGTNTVTLSEYALANIEERSGIGEGTRHRYKREIRRDWRKIGALPIDMVTERSVRQWLRDLERAGASAKTIRNKHGLLSSVLEHAVRDSSVDLSSNPCAHSQLRKDDVQEEMSFLTPDEFAVLLGCMPVQYHAFTAALFGTGMRFSEATAIQVGDYDSQSESLRISRAWKKVPGGWIVGPPKTKRGRRTVEMPDALVAYCEEARQSKAPSDLLFTTARGGRIKHSTFYPDVWVPAVRLANGLRGWPDRPAEWEPARGTMWHGLQPAEKSMKIGKPLRIHDARHTAASWMIASGATPQEVQYALGHESIQTTYDRYGHLMPGRGIKIKRAMSAALSAALPEIEA
ncbi:hypothetical protein GCM10010401_07530 [Rarobacter faecitabidus]